MVISIQKRTSTRETETCPEGFSLAALGQAQPQHHPWANGIPMPHAPMAPGAADITGARSSTNAPLGNIGRPGKVLASDGKGPECHSHIGLQPMSQGEKRVFWETGKFWIFHWIHKPIRGQENVLQKARSLPYLPQPLQFEQVQETIVIFQEIWLVFPQGFCLHAVCK